MPCRWRAYRLVLRWLTQSWKVKFTLCTGTPIKHGFKKLILHPHREMLRSLDSYELCLTLYLRLSCTNIKCLCQHLSCQQCILALRK